MNGDGQATEAMETKVRRAGDLVNLEPGAALGSPHPRPEHTHTTDRIWNYTDTAFDFPPFGSV